MTDQPMDDAAATCNWMDGPFMGICPEIGVRPMYEDDDETNLVAYQGYSVVSNRDLSLIAGFTDELDTLPYNYVLGNKNDEDASRQLVELEKYMAGHEAEARIRTARSNITALVQKAHPEISNLSGCGSYASENDSRIKVFRPNPQSIKFIPPLTAPSSATSAQDSGPSDDHHFGSFSDSANSPSRRSQLFPHSRISPAALAEYAARQPEELLRKRSAPADTNGTSKRHHRCRDDGTGDTSSCGGGIRDQDTEMRDSV